MENQEKVTEEQKNPSSINKCIEKLQKELETWREAGDNHRSYIVIVTEADGTKNEEGQDCFESTSIIGGNYGVLTEAVYANMRTCKDFECIISKAAAKRAAEIIFGDIKN